MRVSFLKFSASLAAGFLLLPAPVRSQPDWADTETPVVFHRNIVAIGQDVHLRTNEVSRDLVVIGGNAIVDGRVDGDVVVVFGRAKINGKVRGALTSVFSETGLGPRADIRREAVIVGGEFQPDPNARVGSHRTEVLFGGALPNFHWFWDWLVLGLLWGRPLPPGVVWVWGVAAAFLGLYLLCAMLFGQPLQRCVERLGRQPGVTFLVGLLGFLLLGPIVALLVASVAGILVVPFVLIALVAAVFFGKIAIYEFTGEQMIRQFTGKSVSLPVLGLVLGVVLFYALYMVPIVGLALWGLGTVWGLGAVLVAIVAGFRRDPELAAAGAPVLIPTGTAVAGASLSGANLSSTAGQGPAQAAATLIPPEMIALVRAGFWIRLMATVLDVLMFVIFFNLVRYGHPRLILFLWFAYHVGMWTWKGTTFGGIVIGLKVVRLDGGPLDLGLALVRSLSSVLSALALGLGFFWAGWDRQKQSWHDKIAGTVVVKVPRGVAGLSSVSVR